MRVVRVVSFVVLAAACRRHDSAVTTNTSPAGTETAVPVAASAPSQADSVASAPSAAPAASASASAAASPPITDKERAAALREAAEYGMLAIISSDAGLGDLLAGPGMEVRDAAAPRNGSLRLGQLTVSGTMPSEVIQRIIRRSFGRFRACYQEGLRNNPSLQGRVTTKFVIDKNGTVVSNQDGGSDVPDQAVVQCVVRAFTTLTFPQPDNGGIVIVIAPLMFDPK